MKNCKLVYPNKQPEDKIIEKTKTVNFEKIKEFGIKPIDNWQNMLIFGDCLSVLKTLLSKYNMKERVRLIYIDPPFSTNHEYKLGKRIATISMDEEGEIAYMDTLTGTEYLEFLRERLILMRELLAKDGSIYVHIDYKVGHYVKIIMDEIFGGEHFINDITRIKCNPKNFPRKAYGNIKDMILFYSKTDKYIWNDPREEFTEEDIKRLFPKLDESGRRYTTTPLHAPGETKNGATGKAWRNMLPPKGRHWRYPPDVLEELDKKGLIEWSSRGIPRKKIYADELVKRGKKRQDVWEFKDRQYPSYPTEKNLDMLKVIISASSKPNDIVLDAFCGSGTTLIASEELNRRWIGIDNSPVAIKISLSRILKIKNHRNFIFYNASNKPLPKAIQEIIQQKH